MLFDGSKYEYMQSFFAGIFFSRKRKRTTLHYIKKKNRGNLPPRVTRIKGL